MGGVVQFEDEVIHLEPCPFCGTSDYLAADAWGGTEFIVSCGKCRMRGPVFSYDDIADAGGYTLPEFQEKEALDVFLIRKAIEAWNGTLGPLNGAYQRGYEDGEQEDWQGQRRQEDEGEDEQVEVVLPRDLSQRVGQH